MSGFNISFQATTTKRRRKFSESFQFRYQVIAYLISSEEKLDGINFGIIFCEIFPFSALTRFYRKDRGAIWDGWLQTEKQEQEKITTNGKNSSQNSSKKEMYRIKAVETVLKRMGLYIYDQLRTEEDLRMHQPTLALWSDPEFVADFEKEVEAELRQIRIKKR
jgi:hypothetical protein